MRTPTFTTTLRSFLAAAAFVLAFAFTGSAHAGAIRISNEPIPTDDEGKLAANAPKNIKELDGVEGEDEWRLHLWAKIDKGADGPLYVEFHTKWNGRTLKVWSYEQLEYHGEKYINYEITLAGDAGFNKDREYEATIIQLKTETKSIKLAGPVKFKLIRTKSAEAEPPEDEEEEGEDEGADEQAGPDDDGADEEPAEDAVAPVEPPPVETPADKRGCRSSDDAPMWGALLLLGLAWRRRS